VLKLKKLGVEVLVQAGAGEGASMTDLAFKEAGAEIAPDAASLYGAADVVLKVRPPALNSATGQHEVDMLKEGAGIIGFIWPASSKELLERLAARKITALAMDAVPRTTRAQKMDALSAMANIAGYRAVIEGARHFGRFLGGQSTAAGRVKPASRGLRRSRPRRTSARSCARSTRDLRCASRCNRSAASSCRSSSTSRARAPAAMRRR
jgi:NAD(P) transhydrogenase subunit alpha